MGDRYLHLDQNGDAYRLSFRSGSEMRSLAQTTDGGESRLSPIFPVNPADIHYPAANDSYFVGFFCYERPLQAIARLQRDVPPDQQVGLCFSIGLASVVFFTRDQKLLNEVQATNRDGLRAAEIWAIEAGIVRPEPAWFATLGQSEQPIPPISEYTMLRPEQILVLDEFSNALNSTIHKSAQYLPSQLEVLRRLVNAVNDLLDELRFLTDPTNAPRPEAFSEKWADSLINDKIQRETLIHQRTGDLVQIAASLMSAKTQGFSGALPLLDSPAPAGTHSLLGVGTAYRGLFYFSMFVENVFQIYPIPSVIRKHLQAPGPVNIFPDLRKYDPAEWTGDRMQQVDAYLDEQTPPEHGKFNIVYYSLRIGFRESTFATTAALPTLAFGDDAKWSLMTLTHEILHAHVAAVLSALFADPNRDLPDDAYRRYAERFFEDYLSRHGEPRQGEPQHLIDSLRSIILHYSHLRDQFQSFGEATANIREQGEEEGTVDGDVYLSEGVDIIFGKLGDAFHEINEILVHVLDYHYFYDTNANLYLSLLWESWCAVPKVLQDVDQYIFRSLVAIASGAESAGQTTTVRFENAVSTLTEVLENLALRNPENVLAEQVLNSLNQPPIEDALFCRFSLGIYLADMARSFLLSKHIHGALYDDDNCHKADGVYHYLIDTGDFRDIVVKSPVAFIADRLRNALEGDSSGLSAEYRAAWLQLACASVEQHR